MKVVISDTETHSLNGYPIEIAYAPCSFEQCAFGYKEWSDAA